MTVEFRHVRARAKTAKFWLRPKAATRKLVRNPVPNLVLGTLAISCTAKQTIHAGPSSLSLAAIVAGASARATKSKSLKNVLPNPRRTLNRVSRPGKATKIATTGIMFVVADGTEAIVVAPRRATSSVKTAHARTHGSTATDLVRCTLSGRMVTAMTTTTTVAAAGMAETVVDVTIVTIFARIVAVAIPSSRATTLVYRNVQLKRGKAMADVTTATISAAVIGTVETVALKQTRN